jgi:hypothetical protein
MREERLLGSLGEGVLAYGEEVGSERRSNGLLLLRMKMWGNGLAVSCALGVGAAAMDLEVRIWMLAVQDAGSGGAVCDVLVDLGALVGDEVGLGIRRRQIGLALLQMLNLAGGVLRAHEAAVETSYFVALAQRSSAQRAWEKASRWEGPRVAMEMTSDEAATMRKSKK